MSDPKYGTVLMGDNHTTARGQLRIYSTGVLVVMRSKVLCLFCFEIYTLDGRGGEKGQSANFKKKQTAPLNQEVRSVKPKEKQTR